jgi:hypothetical protein
MALRRGGGRPKGSLNKRTKAQKEAAENGLSPLALLLAIMRCEEVSLERRITAAAAAAPYIHQKLAQVKHSGADGGPIRVQGTMVIDFSADV